MSANHTFPIIYKLLKLLFFPVYWVVLNENGLIVDRFWRLLAIDELKIVVYPKISTIFSNSAPIEIYQNFVYYTFLPQLHSHNDKISVSVLLP